MDPLSIKGSQYDITGKKIFLPINFLALDDWGFLPAILDSDSCCSVHVTLYLTLDHAIIALLLAVHSM